MQNSTQTDKLIWEVEIQNLFKPKVKCGFHGANFTKPTAT